MKNKRILMTLLGTFGSGFAVGFIVKAALGIDTFTALVTGINYLIPISYGTLYVMVNAVLLLLTLLFDKHYIGLGTIINLLVVGYVVEYTTMVLNALLPNPSMPVRFLLMAIGLLALSFFVSFYITADLGVSTYDALVLIMVNKWKLGSYKNIKRLSDLGCIAIYLSCALLTRRGSATILSMISIGTIITALFMGPLIDYFNNHISKPLLNKQ